MNEVKIFENAQFGQVRTAGTSDEPVFCLSDVCKALGLSAKGVNQRLSDGVISSYPITDSLGRQQQALFVNEDGLYDVILDSRKPEAKAFRKWVTSEVLPSIRKSGGYIAAQPEETPELLMARALKAADEAIQRQKQQLQEANQHIAIAEETIEQQARQIQMANGTIEEQTREIKALAPDAKYTRDVLQSDSTYAISDVAKELRMSGYKLYAKLKALGILFKRGDKWFPYEKYVPKGYFATRTVPFFHRDGTPGSSSYTVLTELGRQWLHSLKIA